MDAIEEKNSFIRELKRDIISEFGIKSRYIYVTGEKEYGFVKDMSGFFFPKDLCTQVWGPDTLSYHIHNMAHEQGIESKLVESYDGSKRPHLTFGGDTYWVFIYMGTGYADNYSVYFMKSPITKDMVKELEVAIQSVLGK